MVEHFQEWQLRDGVTKLAKHHHKKQWRSKLHINYYYFKKTRHFNQVSMFPFWIYRPAKHKMAKWSKILIKISSNSIGTFSQVILKCVKRPITRSKLVKFPEVHNKDTKILKALYANINLNNKIPQSRSNVSPSEKVSYSFPDFQMDEV